MVQWRTATEYTFGSVKLNELVYCFLEFHFLEHDERTLDTSFEIL